MKLAGLKYIRKEFGFTMRELADELNISHNAINIWENGEGDITEVNLNNLTKIFGLSKEYLFKSDFTYEDMIIIEKARSNYKINNFKKLIIEEGREIKEIEYDKLKNEITIETVYENHSKEIKARDKQISDLKQALRNIKTIINSNL